MSCEVCPSKDRVMRVSGVRLCWRCRRVLRGMSFRHDSKITRIAMMKEVLDTWESAIMENTGVCFAAAK